MKKFYASIFAVSLATASFSQFESANIDFNNAGGLVTNGGVFFNSEMPSAAAYEIPLGLENHMIYSMGFWFAGEDVNGHLKLAAGTYEHGGDFHPGALTTSGAAEIPAGETSSKGVYPITKAEIDYHIEHVGEMGYDIPSSIMDWPAHGDVAYDLDFYLAPFIDVDGDGIYDPASGDYPKIKGDKAVYMIVNDKGDLHASGGDPIGIEVHYLFYQYGSDDFLNNTTFINVRAINRGTQTLFNFKAACFMDSDVGESTDDYAGCYADNNVMFGYNADLYDDGTGPITGYGTNPPAIGVVSLNHDIYAYAPGGGGASPSEYYNVMNGYWPDGSHFTEGGTGYGGDTETNFLFNGNPNNPGDWAEANEEEVVPGDRRMMMSTDLDVFRPGQIICLDYAVLYNRDGTPIENAEGIINLAVEAKEFYDTDSEPYCTSGIVGLEESVENNHIQVYPNPNNGSFRIEMEGQFEVSLFAMDGRLVHTQTNNVNQAQIQTDLAEGTYLLRLTRNGQLEDTRLIVVQ